MNQLCSQCQMESSIAICANVFMYIALVVVFLGAFKHKLIVLEMIIEIQTIYYSMITISNMNESWRGLASMKFIGGFFTHASNIWEQRIQVNYQNLMFSSNFVSNFNIMLSSILLCPLLSIIFFIASKFTKAIVMNKKLEEYAKQCMCELLLFVLMFNSFKIIISWIINLQYPNNQAGAIVFGTIMFMTILFKIGIIALIRHVYKEFKKQYNHELVKQICLYFLIAKVFLGSMFLNIEAKIKCSIYLIIVIQLGFVIYLSVFKPYMQKLIFIKQLTNTIITLVALILVAYVSQTSKISPNESSFAYYIPIIILCLIFLILFLTISILIYTTIIQDISPLLLSLKNQKSIQLTQQPVAIQSPLCTQKINDSNNQMIQAMIKYKKQNQFSRKPKFNLSNIYLKKQSLFVPDFASVLQTTQKQTSDMKMKLQDLSMNFN